MRRMLRTRGGRAAVAGVVALAIGGTVIGIVLWQASDDSEDVPVTPLAYEMRLVSSECDEEGINVTVRGEVGNVSTQTFPEVAAVGNFAGATNVTLASAVTDLGEMNPGDIKSFEMTIEQADVFSCSVEFYLPSGRQLRTDESILDPPTATP